MNKTKPFVISKKLVITAFRLIKANGGAAGVDQQSLEDFEVNLKDNLYKLWNRLSSGSYFPPAVKAVPIPKRTGGERILGVPTVTDRIAQMVIRLAFEPYVEPHFLSDSYGYRLNKSALDAVGITRQRCWRYDWLVEYDICGLFDNLSHELLMRAVKKHTDNKWIILYIERWLKAPIQPPNGTLSERTKGVPQGSCIGPVLSNLFLHYVFDLWMSRNFSTVPWCRYADDGLVHCETEGQAQQLLTVLKERFRSCGLELHPEKTKIIYCKDGKRRKEYPQTKFEFLGYEFRRRTAKEGRTGKLFLNFAPGVSKASQKSMQAKLRDKRFYRKTDINLKDMADRYNPMLRGWIEYYGRYNRSTLYAVFRHFNKMLVVWAMRKYTKLNGRMRAVRFLEEIAKREPHLFAHWKIGMRGAFA